MYLCYGQPASMNYFGWENEALPLGNGKIGAKVFGGDKCELISFNEKTLWSGGSDVDGYTDGIANPDGGKSMREISALLMKGDVKAATKRMSELNGNDIGFGGYQAFGSLYIDFSDKTASDKYLRDLDLDSASAMVTYNKGKTNFIHHYFVSYPANVFVGRIEAKEGDAFDFDAYFVSEQKATPKSENCTITCEGTVHENKGINGADGKDKNNMRHACMIRFILKDGTAECKNGHVIVKDTTSVVIIASFATDYINSFPVFSDGSDPLEKARKCVDAAAEKSFGVLYNEHLKDYQALYNRVKFSLGEDDPQQTTDYMLKRFSKRGEYKRALITTLFQYGRYLLISSSRDGSLPANLQGIWNAQNHPKWQSDYHFNINIEMNYWPAFTANLHETAEPYLQYINSLRKPGRIVANKTMGIGENKADGTPDYEKPTGWVVHTMVNPLGFVAPGFDWRWGWAPVNAAFALQNCYEYFLFTRDTDKLKNDIYPAMEEAALLWSQLLIKDEKTGRNVVAPCFSPEHGPVSAGGTYEQSIVYNLFYTVIEAAETLTENGYGDGVNAELIEKLKELLPTLKPYAIGKNGQILEWEKEGSFSASGRKEGVQRHHRHISHLLGLYPFNQITRDDFVLKRGAEKSLEKRGIKTTGWALAQRLLSYARLENGDKCDDIIEQMLKTMILKNLFGNHPPFQIDCNFGFTAGVCEMLLQSHCGYIKLLPALPFDWPMGEVSGIMARGGFEFALTWDRGRLKEGNVKSLLGGKCSLYYDGKIIIVTDENGNELETVYDEKGITSFETEKGKTYKFS